jgi:hypothetical protein
MREPAEKWLLTNKFNGVEGRLKFMKRHGRLKGKKVKRKLWLYTCAAARRVWHLLPDERTRKAIEAAELRADGLIDQATFEAAWQPAKAAKYEAWDAMHKHSHDPDENVQRKYGYLRVAAEVACYACEDNPIVAACEAEYRIPWVVRDEAFASGRENWEELYNAETGAQEPLFVHIMGNPFRRHPASEQWPSAIVQLAESLYAGQDCAFALHDALLEAGHAELAEHFREEKSHPKGCWVVDVILGKK